MASEATDPLVGGAPGSDAAARGKSPRAPRGNGAFGLRPRGVCLIAVNLVIAAALLALGLGKLWGGAESESEHEVGSVDEKELEEKLMAENVPRYDVPLTVLSHKVGYGVCLDGSPPAYHMSPGWGEGATKWVVFLEGGAWCHNDAECEERANTPLGSSHRMGRYRFDGILSNSSLLNPFFYNWNAVYVRYCDGASFSGKAASLQRPFRQGHMVFDRVVKHLLARGMNKATHALLAGCSAGGLAAMLQCDNFAAIVRAHVRKAARDEAAQPDPADTTSDAKEGERRRLLEGKAPVVVKCMSDGGFFLDAQGVFGSRAMRNLFSSVVSYQSPQMSEPCLQNKDVPSFDAACFFPENFLKFARTPFFILNSMYDNWAISNAFVPSFRDKGVEWRSCAEDLSKCTEPQLTALTGYKDQMAQAAQQVLKEPKDGAFLLSCHIHCQSLWSNTWHGPNAPKIQDKTMAAAVGEWFTGGTPKPALIDCSYPCNPTCFNWHGNW